MKKIAAAFALSFTAVVAVCKPATEILSLDRVFTVDEFDRDFALRQRVLATCNSNPGQLRNDPNCVNSLASHLGNGADEDRQYQARRVAAAQDIGVIMVGLMLYRLDNGAYPTQKQGLRALTQKPSIAPVPSNWKEGGYLQSLPNDPFGHPYRYLDPGVHGDIDVYSVGSDQLAGDESAVIGSWQPWVHKYTEAVMKQAESAAQ
jgi:general secretion pathway protein G